jgi:hypothetical protein
LSFSVAGCLEISGLLPVENTRELKVDGGLYRICKIGE